MLHAMLMQRLLLLLRTRPIGYSYARPTCTCISLQLSVHLSVSEIVGYKLIGGRTRL